MLVLQERLERGSTEESHSTVREGKSGIGGHRIHRIKGGLGDPAGQIGGLGRNLEYSSSHKIYRPLRITWNMEVLKRNKEREVAVFEVSPGGVCDQLFLPLCKSHRYQQEVFTTC